MSLNLKVARLTPPVTDAELKDFAKIDSTDEDALITILNEVATDFIEKLLAMSLITTEWELNLDAFPIAIDGGDCPAFPDQGFGTGRAFFEIHRTPIQTVESIKYIDENGDLQTLAATEYDVDTKATGPSRVVESLDADWPTAENTINSVTVCFTSGFGDATDEVPEPLKHIIKLYFLHLYEHRDSYDACKNEEVPFLINALLDCYRIKVFG